MADLPVEILEAVERTPVEDMALAILRARYPNTLVVSQVRAVQTMPAILVRRSPTLFQVGGDERFIETADLSVHTFAVDPNGDRDAALMADAARVALRDAWLNQFGNADLGWVKRMETLSLPRRVPDWATGQGPVQFATLPANAWRYEGRYRLTIRKPTNHPYSP